MKRNVLNSPRLSELKKKRRVGVFKRVFISLLGFSAIFALSAYLSRLDGLNIKEIQIVGNKLTDTFALKAATEELIAGKYLWLFPKTNKLYYPQNKIKKKNE